MAAFAPVEAGLAHGAARVRQRFGVDLQRLGHEALALASEFDVLFCLPDQPLLAQAVEHLHAEIAGQMIVADPRPPQRRLFRSGAHAGMAGALGQASKAFEHMGDVGAGETVVAVTALFLRLDQAAGFELCQMRTRGLRRDAGLVRQLARGQRAAGHQRGQHVGARGIADQRGDHGNVGACFHSSMIAEASTSIKRVL